MRLLPAFMIATTLLASPAAATTLEQQMHRAPLGDTGAIETWLTAHPHAPARQRADAFGLLCKMEQRQTQYRAAADACGRMVDLQGAHPDAASLQSLGVWRALSNTPPIQVHGEVDAPLSYGWTGIAEVSIETRGTTMSWGVDTGAELSTMRASDAARLHVRMLDASLEIHGSTPGTSAGHVGVIDEMHIGGARIENVPVFVVPDAAMTFGDHAVPPLLGGPILYAFGRVEFADHGQRLRLTAAQTTPMPGHLSWNESGVAIELGLPRGRLEAHLDTGANVSELNQSTRALLTSLQRAHLTLSSARVAGVSGQIERQRWRSAPLDVEMGGGLCRVESMNFGPETGGAQGRVGIDLVKSCADFVFDVSTMSFAARGA